MSRMTNVVLCGFAAVLVACGDDAAKMNVDGGGVDGASGGPDGAGGVDGASGGPDGAGDLAISDQPLSGMVAGQAWTFVEGGTGSTGTVFFANLYAESYEECSDFNHPTSSHLVISELPRQVGTYALGRDPSPNVNFASGSQNNATIAGRLAVVEVTGTSLSGGLRAEFDDQNQVDGRFQVTLCPNL